MRVVLLQNVVFRFFTCVVALLLVMSLPILADTRSGFVCDTLVVSGNPEYPPLLWQSDQAPGQLIGAVPAFLREIVAPLGIDVEVRDKGSWARVQRLAQLGEIDLVAGAFMTSERIGYMDYVVPPMMHLPTNVWVPKDRPFVYRHWPDLKGKQGGTLINNSFGQRFDQYAVENLMIDGVRSIDQSFLMALAERVDYVLYEKLQGRVKLGRLGLADQFVALDPPVSREGLFFAFPKRSSCNSVAFREAFMERLTLLSEQKRLDTLIEEYTVRYVGEQ
ncbi:MAG: polar amino acid transport system substrate-binding protein [Marinobacter excellens HL-55]|uniref:Polar amino acid transport system substrate-binding protein n=1 Tax=Marinobacter excellens HL-55 TaxID=1305731 RepID=A0A0N8KLC3_9GAMM|nr:MAG: polar amino acid transport system substrate-binding protein [Marinobacter excellens HL-55]